MATLAFSLQLSAISLLLASLAMAQTTKPPSGSPGPTVFPYMFFGGGTWAIDDCVKFDANRRFVSAGAACGSGQGGGEANTASNVGTVGVGVFKQKSLLDLQFYKLNSANNLLSIALVGTDRIDLTINEGNFSFGDVSGPASSGDNRIARFDLATGKLIQNSLALIDDNGFIEQGIGWTAGSQFLVGRAGDTGRSSVYVRAGDTAAEPPYLRLPDHLGNDSFLFPCGSLAGRWCQDSAEPASPHTNPLLSASSSDTVSNKILDNSNRQNGYIDWDEIALPGTNPSASRIRVYARSGRICWLNSGGTETCTVTGGDLHDHSGGDGAQIAYAGLGGLPTLGDSASRNVGTLVGDVATGDRGVTNGDSHNHDGGDGGQIAYSSVSGTPSLNGGIQFILDGGGSAITTGAKGWIRVPFACTITSWELTADQSGSIVLDLWKDTYANFPPLVADTITASAKPTLSAVQKNTDATLTGWTTAVAAGDYIRVNVDSAATVTYAVLSIQVTKQ